MARSAYSTVASPGFSIATAVELLKPITWFAPMWAFSCGVISAGYPIIERWPEIIAGIVLAGPLVCGTSQAVNDWFDRHVDAINEPNRPIPSGRIPGNWGFIIAFVWTIVSAVVALALGWWVFVAAIVGLSLAWAYSAPPLRLKQNGWYGNLAVGGCYEGLPWFTGAAIMANALPDWTTIAIAALYSLGAHGIMTLNDFKSIEGDRKMGVRSIPAQMGAPAAARLACIVMIVPQLFVVALLASVGLTIHAGIITFGIVVQVALMRHLLTQPRELAPWYNATGTLAYVLGMLVAAFALAQISGTSG